jgi:nucleolar MIF4G domain-containing protein 1
VSGSQNLGGVSAEYLSLYAALLCYLHVQTGGGATGAHFLEGCAKQLETALDPETRNAKAASNIVQMFAYFFLVEMVSASLIYDLIRKFCERLTELDVEMVLLLLRTCGFKIRQDDPISLKEIVLLVEKRAAAKAAGETMQEQHDADAQGELDANAAGAGAGAADAAAETGGSKRLDFMLSTISDLRNNRERPSDINGGVRSRAKLLTDWVYSKESKGGGVDSGEVTLPVRLETLLAPDSTKKGLWWLEARLERGSLRKGDGSDDRGTGQDPFDEPEMSADLMALARKMRMSTDIRKAVFCAVMGADDYTEASRELARLAPQLKPPQDREIIRVIFECCTQEKAYNPYYAALLRSVCGAHGAGNHAYTLRFSFWDLLKDADGTSRRKLENAAQLLATLLLDKSPRIGT